MDKNDNANIPTVKSAEEIDLMKKAQRITETALSNIIHRIKAGITETELAAEIDKEFIKLGADGSAFPSIVAFGESAAECHHIPTERKLEKGEIVLIDIGAKFNGYCSDMTRTFCYGIPDRKMSEIYAIVLGAQQSALRHIKAGMTCREADAIAREYIAANGYGKEFIHTLGHGVGKEVHEAPRLAVGNDIPLEAGMVVTVEPGIYIEGWGGVRIEDMAVIKNDGIDNLTAFDKKFIL